MKPTIHPDLLSYSLDGKWQESGGQFGEGPSIRWAAHFEVRLRDLNDVAKIEKSKWLRFKNKHASALLVNINKNGALGELFGYTVCSPAFLKKPDSEATEDELKRVYVQDSFDEKEAIQNLRDKIREIGDVSIQKATVEFHKFLDTEEWDYSLEGKAQQS